MGFRKGDKILYVGDFDESITKYRIYTFDCYALCSQGRDTMIRITDCDDGAWGGFNENFYDFIPATNLHRILYGINL